MRGLAALAAATLLVMTSPVVGQELSTEVFPSEDELSEALDFGWLTLHQYLILREIITHGLDSANLHLRDEIPNLAFFATPPDSLMTSLQHDQQASFQWAPVPSSRTPVWVNYQYGEELESFRRARYRVSCRVRPVTNMEMRLNVHREYSGRERIVSRWLSYDNPRCALSEVVIGNFSRRFGVGTVFGYRGKLLEFSDHIDGESLLYPDFGGANGVYVHYRAAAVDMQGLVSVVRDKHHALLSAAGMVSVRAAAMRHGIIWGVNRLQNRETGKAATDIKYGWHAGYDRSDGSMNWELSGQRGQRSSFGALVLEGRRRFGRMNMEFSGWVYGDDYLDLSGGSKAANISRYSRLDDVDLIFWDRRSGQEGGLVRSTVLLAEGLQMVNSLIFAGRNEDSADIQSLSSLTRAVASGTEIRMDYLSKTVKRVDFDVQRRARLEVRYRQGDLKTRAYIAYETRARRRDCVAVFGGVTYRSPQLGNLEVWLNLARLDVDHRRIDYWYGFVRGRQRLFGYVTVATKLSHRYHRGASARHRTGFHLEVEAAI